MPHNPCCQQQSEHKIRFMDDDSSGPCVFHSRKTLDEIKSGAILSNIFEVVGDIEHKISTDESKTPYVRFVGRHTGSGKFHNFIAENITTKQAFQFTP